MPLKINWGEIKMGYDRIETFVKNEEKPYEYCLDFEYGNSAYAYAH